MQRTTVGLCGRWDGTTERIWITLGDNNHYTCNQRGRTPEIRLGVWGGGGGGGGGGCGVGDGARVFFGLGRRTHGQPASWSERIRTSTLYSTRSRSFWCVSRAGFRRGAERVRIGGAPPPSHRSEHGVPVGVAGAVAGGVGGAPTPPFVGGFLGALCEVGGPPRVGGGFGSQKPHQQLVWNSSTVIGLIVATATSSFYGYASATRYTFAGGQRVRRSREASRVESRYAPRSPPAACGPAHPFVFRHCRHRWAGWWVGVVVCWGAPTHQPHPPPPPHTHGGGGGLCGGVGLGGGVGGGCAGGGAWFAGGGQGVESSDGDTARGWGWGGGGGVFRGAGWMLV